MRHRSATRLGRGARLVPWLASAFLLATVVPGAGAAARTVTPTPPPAGAGSSAGVAAAKVTFGVQPASVVKGHGRPDARPYFYYSATPGATLTDHVAILNYSTKPLILNVYATDAVNTADGGFALLPAQTKPTDAGSWVRLGDGRSTYTVPARSRNRSGQQLVGMVVVPLTVTIPPGTSPGDHTGGVVASLDTIARNKQGARVRLDQRVGTRMFIRIAGPLHPALRVEDLKITYHGTSSPLGAGSATVTYRVRNAGNVKLGARQKLAVSGWFGGTGRVPKLTDVPLLLPGGAVPERVEVASVSPEFRLTARVTLYPLQLQGDADPKLPSSSASATTWALPWSAVVILLVLVLVLAAGLWFLRRRRARRPAGRHGADKQRTTTAARPVADPAPDQPQVAGR